MASMAIPELGRLVDVDIRSVWKSEPYAFDPWLTQPENLQFLADSLGIPGLEVLETQASVGPFYADIVAQIIGTDHKVVIENQLDKADHRHLGQVLTYAPKFDARVCVWVAAQICDEHRAAVDWLNRITGEGYAFFGVEVRAVRIGESQPAPIFDVVAKPNDFSRLVAQAAYDSGEIPEHQSENLEYWSDLHAALEAAGLPTRRASKPLKIETYWIPILGSQVYFWAFRSTGRNPYVKAGLTFYSDSGFRLWSEFQGRKDQIIEQFGENLEWTSNKQNSAWQIVVPARPNEGGKEDWPEQIAWLVERLAKLEAIFGPAIRSANV